jgi:hypothetical protein
VNRPQAARKRASATAVALLGGIFIALAGPSTAFASDVNVPLSWIDPATLTVAYGDYWTFTVATPDSSSPVPGPSPVTVTGATTPFSSSVSFFADTTDGDRRGFIFQPLDRQPLEVGHYTFSVSTTKDASGDHYIYATATPAQLTITKAPLGVDLRIVNDPSSTKNAIVALRLTGTYIDNLYPADGDPSAPLAPAGTWALTVTGADGNVALKKSIDQAAGFASSLSFYWPDIPHDTTYNATATFTPAAASAGNFAVSPSTPVSYTSSPAATPEPVPTEASATTHKDPGPQGFSLPLWSIILLVILIVGLAVTVTILAIKSAGSPPTVGAHT